MAEGFVTYMLIFWGGFAETSDSVVFLGRTVSVLHVAILETALNECC